MALMRSIRRPGLWELVAQSIGLPDDLGKVGNPASLTFSTGWHGLLCLSR
ncbi:hypothetical protein At1D1108_45660 (plasmid) [Agrobacterium tumefaciens]|nr:hypothetical protein At1D1108_45660 [Agrobacterium tumefaciens]